MASKPKSDPKPRKPRTPVPENETKSQRFVRLAQKRVPKAIKAINGIAALAGNGYEFTDEQRDKVIDALESAVKSTVASLKRERKAAVEFVL